MGLETRPLAADGSEAALADSHVESPALDLPPIAAQADDLEAIKKAVDDAASLGGGLWLSYLFVLFYLAVAAGAVTHADLFLEKSVKLPFLNVELPLLAFFFLAPILFLFVHAYALVHLVLLTDKTKRFHQVLDAQIPNKKGMTKDQQSGRAAIRAGLRRQLPSNIFVQFLAGRVTFGRIPSVVLARDCMVYARRRAFALAAALPDSVPSLPQQFRHLDPSRRAPRGSHSTLVVVAQDPVWALGLHQTAARPLGVVSPWSRYERHRHSILVGLGHFPRRVADGEFHSLATHP